MWKSSGFNATYSLTVRLFNPNPNDNDTTRRTLAAPLCALLCLGLPIAHGTSYSWPFVHIIEAPGMFASKAVAVQNITVIKGGDNNLHAMSGMAGIIDVRIDFVNLYEPMLAGDTSGLQYRTNLTNYLDNICTGNVEIGLFNESASFAAQVASTPNSAGTAPSRAKTPAPTLTADTAFTNTETQQQNWNSVLLSNPSILTNDAAPFLLPH